MLTEKLPVDTCLGQSFSIFFLLFSPNLPLEAHVAVSDGCQCPLQVPVVLLTHGAPLPPPLLYTLGTRGASPLGSLFTPLLHGSSLAVSPPPCPLLAATAAPSPSPWSNSGSGPLCACSLSHTFNLQWRVGAAVGSDCPAAGLLWKKTLPYTFCLFIYTCLLGW